MVNTEIRLIAFFAAKDGEALYSQQKTGMKADCGSNHELLIAKFRLKLKKVEKPLDHSGMTYGQRFVTLYRRQGSRPSPWKRNVKKQNGCLRRPYK